MRKGIIRLSAALMILLVFSSIASAQGSIVDSMDFQVDAKIISVNDAITLVTTNNPEIKTRELEIEQAKITAGRYTDAAIAAHHVYNDPSSVNYLQTVKVNDINAEYTKATAKRNFDATIEKLKSEAQQSYYSLLQAEQSEKIYLDNLNVSKTLFDTTKKKFDLGLVAKQEVLNSELNYITAQKDYNIAKSTVKNAKMSLNVKLGLPVMNEIKPKDELKYTEYNLGSIASAVEKAIKNRNEIKALEYKYELQSISAKAQKALSEVSNPYILESLKLEQATKDLEDNKKNIELEVRSNYLDVQQKQEEIKSGEKSVETAAEALKIAQISYEKGMNTLTDVQKAQVALQQAKLGLSKSMLNHKLAILKYEVSTGVGKVVSSSSSSGY